jgi:hypothetical protein
VLAALCSLACSSGAGDPHARLCLEGWADYPEQAEAIQEAASDWRQVTGGEVALSFESAELEADCSPRSVPVVAAARQGEVSGYTEPDRIWLAADSPRMGVMARHELGHFVGLLDHSDDPRDIMYERWTPAMSPTLTMGDLALWLEARGE